MSDLEVEPIVFACGKLCSTIAPLNGVGFNRATLPVVWDLEFCGLVKNKFTSCIGQRRRRQSVRAFASHVVGFLFKSQPRQI